MQLIAADIPSNCDLVLMGDDHEGSKLKHQLGVEKCLDFVMAERYRRLIHMGDAMEAVQIDDKRYMENTQDDAHPRNQEDAVKKQYKRVSKRTVTRLLGNHCLKLWRHGNYVEKICAEHGIKTPSLHRQIQSLKQCHFRFCIMRNFFHAFIF